MCLHPSNAPASPIILLHPSHSVSSLAIFASALFGSLVWIQFEKGLLVDFVFFLFRADMLLQPKEAYPVHVFLSSIFIVFVLFSYLLAIADHVSPFFVQLKQPNTFPPLAVFLFSCTWAQTSETRRRPLCPIFPQKASFCLYQLLIFFALRPPFAFLYLYPSQRSQKAQTTTFW